MAFLIKIRSSAAANFSRLSQVVLQKHFFNDFLKLFPVLFLMTFRISIHVV